MAEIEIPTFDWTAFYYPEILEALFQFKRRNVPELSDESPQEPFVQLMRMLAVVGHLNNVLGDDIAHESTLTTARLQETVRNMLRLVGYELASDSPATADVVYELAQVLATAIEIVPANAQAGTRSTPTEPTRFYEALDALTTQRTDRMLACFGVEDGVFTDHTTDANDLTPGTDFTPWVSPVGGSATREGDRLMFCHGEVMWNRAALDILTAAADLVGIWEYYDGIYDKARPDSLVNNGVTLTLNLTDYLGAVDRRGTPIRVRLNDTGAFEDLFTDFVGGVNVVTSSLLGQSTPSTNPEDYTVGSPWSEFTNLVDGSAGLTADGNVDFDLPQTVTEDWRLGTFNGVTGFWMSFRIISVAVPTAPAINFIRIDLRRQFAKRLVTQGRQQIDDPIGSSDGSADQRFEGSKEHYLDATGRIFVDDVEWARVDNFLASRPTDRHFRVELTTNNRPVFIFGDGVAGGAIPPVGVSNIRAEYRFGADIDGNVGDNAITVDKTGLTYINRLWNPRKASGWSAAEGSTPESLEQAKIDGPASLRTRNVAIGPQDTEDLVRRAYQIDSSVVRIVRSRAIEEGFGPKTIELIVVAPGAAALSQTALDAITTFFNGDRLASPPIRKRMVSNQEVTAVNYQPRVINVTATVEAGRSVTAAQINAALAALVHPEALKEDGTTYEWDFGGKVAVSRIGHTIFKVDESISDVDVTVPAADVILQARELPVLGTVSITLIVV